MYLLKIFVHFCVSKCPKEFRSNGNAFPCQESDRNTQPIAFGWGDFRDNIGNGAKPKTANPHHGHGLPPPKQVIAVNRSKRASTVVESQSNPLPYRGSSIQDAAFR